MKKKIISLILAVLMFISAIGSYAFAIEDIELPNEIDSFVESDLVSQSSDGTKTIVITKKIPVSDIDWVHGNPAFVYRIETVDEISTSNNIYNAIIELNKDDASVVDGYFVQSITVNVPSDIYVLTEYNALRYSTESVGTPANSSGMLIAVEQDGSFVQSDEENGNGVYFDLSKGDGEASFVSEKTNWGRASHTATVINQIGS